MRGVHQSNQANQTSQISQISCGRGYQENRTEQIPIRFSPSERKSVVKIAAMEHEYPSSFLRRLILKHLEQTN
jgi:hypothetical protein